MFIAPIPAVTVEGIRLDRLVGVLCEIGGVERLADLGTNGPLLASAGTESLFHCLFGRDALRMALDLLDDFPAVARSTLVELASLQGVVLNLRSEEEPGRILHESRVPDDPHALRLAQTDWSFPYYGSVDATPQWVNLLGAYCERCGPDVLDVPLTDRASNSITLRDSLASAVAWIIGRLDSLEAGGFVWVRRANPNGIANQVWEDSYDAYYQADGTLFDASRPFAPVAVQGYAYDALLIGADLLGNEWLRSRARQLRESVLAAFWQADLRTFALALTFERPGDAIAARVVGSDPGHLLATRLLDGDDVSVLRRVLIERLLEADLLSCAGIRTKSTTAARFSPGGYHNGSSWPMDTGVIADGLRRHGAARAATDLEDRILSACREIGGFPEFLRGDLDRVIRVNETVVETFADGQPRRLEQPPQMDQGWTATRVWRILRQRNLVALA